MNVRYGGDLKIGDLVSVCHYNHISVGFYAGRGIGDSFQWYEITSVASWVRAQGERQIPKKPWKNYINSPSIYRISKFHPEFITDPQDKLYYEISLEVMKKLNICE